MVIIMIKDTSLLLHPTIPPSLYGTNPRTILGKKWWDVERRKAYESNMFCCHCCNWHKDSEYNIGRNVLHAHECYNIDFESGRVVLDKIVALCVTCHDFIHIHRLGVLFDRGEVDAEYCYLVTNRGLQLLRAEVLPQQPDYSKYAWDHFYLDIDGVKHYGQFKTREDMLAHYKGED
jgi:hypothetical protein